MVRIVAAKFVVPYRLSGKRGKHDVADGRRHVATLTNEWSPRVRLLPPHGQLAARQSGLQCGQCCVVKPCCEGERACVLKVHAVSHIAITICFMVIRSIPCYPLNLEYGSAIQLDFCSWCKCIAIAIGLVDSIKCCMHEQ